MLVVLLWVLIAMQVLGALGTITMVGKKREPITGGLAAGVVVINVLVSLILVWAIIELT